MLDGILAPSMMCVNFFRMEETLSTFKEASISLLHIDVMDGEFVPNYALGTDFCKQLRSLSDIPLDIHLMITRPDLKLDRFAIQPGEFVSVHWESSPHIPRVLDAIKDKGAKAMVALNPATPIEVLNYIADRIDGVLLMTVNPGYAGQKLLPSTIDKITHIRRFLDDIGHPEIDIEVDGNVSFENAKIMREAGANIFVAGSSSVFSQSDTLLNNIEKMQRIIA